MQIDAYIVLSCRQHTPLTHRCFDANMPSPPSHLWSCAWSRGPPPKPPRHFHHARSALPEGLPAAHRPSSSLVPSRLGAAARAALPEHRCTGRLTLDGLRAVLRLKLRRQPDSRPPRQHGQLVVSCRSCTSLAMSVSRGPSDRRGLAIAHRSMIEQICLESRPHTRSRRRPVSLLV